MPALINIKQKKEALLKALEIHLGIVTYACRDCKINRQSFYSWYRDDPEFKKSYDEIENVVLDFVESKLFNNINNGDQNAINTFLKYKGKKRGYVEKDINVNNQIILNIKKNNDDDINDMV